MTPHVKRHRAARSRSARTAALAVMLAASLTARQAGATTVIPDPINDAAGSHDITSISGGFDSTHLIFAASFRPGTLNPANLGFLIGFDTDLNSSTGTQPPSFPVGQDYGLFFNALQNPSAAQLSGPVGPPIPVTFGTDSFTLSVPLSRLGNDDGVARFCLIVGIAEASGAFLLGDVAPNSANGGALGGPTTPVPEPTTFALAALSLPAVLLAARRRALRRDLVRLPVQ